MPVLCCVVNSVVTIIYYIYIYNKYMNNINNGYITYL